MGSLTYDEYKNNVSAEIIHGRFAMLAVCGAWAQENTVGTPWFMAGSECTFEKCEISYLNNSFTPSYSGALFGLIFIEMVLMGMVMVVSGKTVQDDRCVSYLTLDINHMWHPALPGGVF